jgi:ferredoxin
MASGDDHTVTLVREDGEREGVDADECQTILTATTDGSVDVRYGCREGRCVSCTGLLIDGEIEHVTEPEALDAQHREEGFVLLCVSRPIADCRVEVGKHVLAEAFPHLWRTETGATTERLRTARRKLNVLDDVDVHDADHLDHMRGALARFPNLHEVSEAYCRVEE